MLSGWVAMGASLGTSQPSRVPDTPSEVEALWPGRACCVEQITELEAGL